MQPIADEPGSVNPDDLDELSVNQLFKQLLGIVEVLAEQGGEIPGREIGVDQAEHPEGALLGSVAAPVAERK